MKKSILKYFKAFTMIGVMASVIVLSSCGEDDGPSEPAATETIWEILEGTDNLSSLEAELLAVGLDANLKADGEFTLFAPTNAALNTLLGTLNLEDFSTVSNDIAVGVLAYHVHAGTILSTDLAEGSSFSTLQGESFEVLAGPEILSGATTNATFQVTDIKATNGTIHIIEVVMIPPTIGGAIVATLNTLAQPVLLGADFSILASGIAKADAGKADTETILGALIAGTDLTVFAPTNATFYSAAGVEEGDDQATIDTKVDAAFGSLTGAQWDGIIRNHVVVGQGGGTDDEINTLGPDDLTTGSTYSTLAGGSLLIFNDVSSVPANNGVGIYIDANGDVDLTNPTTLANLDAEVALPDAVKLPNNNRIHVIAGILNPN